MKGKLYALLFCLLCLSGCGAVSGVPQVPATPAPTLSTLPTGTAAVTRVPPSTQTTTITHMATPAATPVATVAPNTHPTLGQSIAAWDSYYGAFQTVSTTQEKMHAYVDKGLTPALAIVVGYDPMQGNRVFTITVRLNDTHASWSHSNMTSMDNVLVFVPKQSWPETQVDTATGSDLQWYDTMLATAFPAVYFMDNAGNIVTRGTFNIFYRYSDKTQKTIDHATIGLGKAYGL